MAEGVDVGKLRQVLDYWSCETCLDVYSPEQDYLCGVCARLNREVVVKRAMLGSDEAVQVIAPEDFTMAKDLRDRIQQQELELGEARAQAMRLQAREQDLENALKRLQEDLTKARREKEEAGLVPFEFVGVKAAEQPEPEEEILEFEEDASEPAQTTPEWETVEAPQAETEFVAVSEPTQPQTAPASSVEAPQPPTEEPSPSARAAAADDAIARIEAEIGKIEQELTELAEKEKDLKEKAKPSRRRSK